MWTKMSGSSGSPSRTQEAVAAQAIEPLDLDGLERPGLVEQGGRVDAVALVALRALQLRHQRVAEIMIAFDTPYFDQDSRQTRPLSGVILARAN